jgi:glycosyltransferase involved in cell wall biosynthesis
VDLGLQERIEFAGQLAPAGALRELATAHVMAMPSEDEAFGVAYVEALACGVPAIGLASEGGPAEIASLGPGMLLVPPRDPAALAEAIQTALADPELPAQARRTAAEQFSWQRCGRDTVAAYRDALAG